MLVYVDKNTLQLQKANDIPSLLNTNKSVEIKLFVGKYRRDLQQEEEQYIILTDQLLGTKKKQWKMDGK